MFELIVFLLKKALLQCLQLLRRGIWDCMTCPCLCLCWVLGWWLGGALLDRPCMVFQRVCVLVFQRVCVLHATFQFFYCCNSIFAPFVHIDCIQIITCTPVSTCPHPHRLSWYLHVILPLPLTGRHPPLTINLTLAPTLPSNLLHISHAPCPPSWFISHFNQTRSTNLWHLISFKHHYQHPFHHCFCFSSSNVVHPVFSSNPLISDISQIPKPSIHSILSYFQIITFILVPC